jgi:hypothetical protein
VRGRTAILSCAVLGVLAAALALAVRYQRRLQIPDGVMTLPNGLKIERKTLASGQLVSRTLAPDGGVIDESHLRGGSGHKTALGLIAHFDHGKKAGESYLYDGHLASREVYERERAAYPDMPAADTTVVDRGMDDDRKLKEDRARQQVEAKRRATLSPAQQLDLQCEDAMAKPEHEDLAEWRKTGRPVVLGELDEKSSGAIVSDLLAAGAVRVVATEVAKDPQRGLDTNWIVAEIPTDPGARKKLFALFDRLADKDGWDPTPDVGQRYQLLGKFKWLPWTRWP